MTTTKIVLIVILPLIVFGFLFFALFVKNRLECDKHFLILQDQYSRFEQRMKTIEVDVDNKKPPVKDRKTFLSQCEVVRQGNIHGGLGLDSTYWQKEVIFNGIRCEHGISIHPKDGGESAFVEFRIPEGCEEIIGWVGLCDSFIDPTSRGNGNFRIFVDGYRLEENRVPQRTFLKTLRINTHQKSILRIETDDGGDGNHSDMIAFGEMKLQY